MKLVCQLGGMTLVVFLMICDILSGIFKAIAQKRGINSTIGTNGLIRKAGVLLALLVFMCRFSCGIKLCFAHSK